MLNSILPVALGVLVITASPDTGTARHMAFDAEDVLAKTRAAIRRQGHRPGRNTGPHRPVHFRTLFIREPRYLLIDYRAVASEYQGGHRVPFDARTVISMENGELQTWISRTQAHETYPSDGGQQVNALTSSGYGTVGISVLIPSHRYSKSGMASAVHATEEPEADGFEAVNGRRCFRILGVERWRPPSGRETGVRPITLWIDAETYLIHKIVQDTPKGMPRGSIHRQITTLKHQATPKLEPAQFHFTVPTS